MAASVDITNITVDGTTATVTVTTDVDNASQCELNWASTGDSEVDIPFDRINFQVDAGVTERVFPVDFSVPSGQTATVIFTANVIDPDVATTQETVQITGGTGGGGGGSPPNEGGISLEMGLAGLGLLALAVYVLSGDEE